MRLPVPLLFITFFVYGCTPYAYFSTANDFRNQDCTVHLRNGKTIRGSLTVQFETGQETEKYLYIKTEDQQEEKILIDSVGFYTRKSASYFPKQVDLGAYLIPYRDRLNLLNQRNLVFLKLISQPDPRLELYELYQSKTRSMDGADHYYYFAAFPAQNGLSAWHIGGNLFLPKFHEKMSQIVYDCPTLSNKIRQQQKGYTFSQLSLDLKKLEVFKRIIEEYHNCKP